VPAQMPPSSEPSRSDPSSKDYSRRSQRWNTTSPPSSSTNPEHERLSSTPRARGVCIRPTQRTLQFWSLVCDATPSRAQYPSRRIIESQSPVCDATIQFQSFVCDATPSRGQDRSRRITQSHSLVCDAPPFARAISFTPHYPVPIHCLRRDTFVRAKSFTPHYPVPIPWPRRDTFARTISLPAAFSGSIPLSGIRHPSRARYLPACPRRSRPPASSFAIRHPSRARYLPAYPRRSRPPASSFAIRHAASESAVP
jgi:hypothetical protein